MRPTERKLYSGLNNYSIENMARSNFLKQIHSQVLKHMNMETFLEPPQINEFLQQVEGFRSDQTEIELFRGKIKKMLLCIKESFVEFEVAVSSGEIALYSENVSHNRSSTGLESCASELFSFGNVPSLNSLELTNDNFITLPSNDSRDMSSSESQEIWPCTPYSSPKKYSNTYHTYSLRQNNNPTSRICSTQIHKNSLKLKKSPRIKRNNIVFKQPKPILKSERIYRDEISRSQQVPNIEHTGECETLCYPLNNKFETEQPVNSCGAMFSTITCVDSASSSDIFPISAEKVPNSIPKNSKFNRREKELDNHEINGIIEQSHSDCIYSMDTISLVSRETEAGMTNSLKNNSEIKTNASSNIVAINGNIVYSSDLQNEEFHWVTLPFTSTASEKEVQQSDPHIENVNISPNNKRNSFQNEYTMSMEIQETTPYHSDIMETFSQRKHRKPNPENSASTPPKVQRIWHNELKNPGDQLKSNSFDDVVSKIRSISISEQTIDKITDELEVAKEECTNCWENFITTLIDDSKLETIGTKNDRPEIKRSGNDLKFPEGYEHHNEAIENVIQEYKTKFGLKSLPLQEEYKEPTIEDRLSTWSKLLAISTETQKKKNRKSNDTDLLLAKT